MKMWIKMWIMWESSGKQLFSQMSVDNSVYYVGKLWIWMCIKFLN